MLFVAVHVGCGYHAVSKEPSLNLLCAAACKAAMDVLKSGSYDAMNAATAACKVLEESPLTNTGFGSNLNSDGQVECDASAILSADSNPRIAEHYGDHSGAHMMYGAVGAVSGVKYPSEAAEVVARTSAKEQDDLTLICPNFLAGHGAEEFIKENGIGLVPAHTLIAPEAKRRYDDHSSRKNQYLEDLRQLKRRKVGNTSCCGTKNDCNKSNEENEIRYDTVGVICLDSSGRSAAVSSSGGISLKRAGRIGQAATFGAGCYANTCAKNDKGQLSKFAVAASTTGNGEELVKTQLASECCRTLELHDGLDIMISTFGDEHVIASKKLGPRARREAGLIAFRANTIKGVKTLHFVHGHSTNSMGIGYFSDKDDEPKCQVFRPAQTSLKKMHMQSIKIFPKVVDSSNIA